MIEGRRAGDDVPLAYGGDGFGKFEIAGVEKPLGGKPPTWWWDVKYELLAVTALALPSEMSGVEGDNGDSSREVDPRGDVGDETDNPFA